jgi:hypothetical protein
MTQAEWQEVQALWDEMVNAWVTANAGTYTQSIKFGKHAAQWKIATDALQAVHPHALFKSTTFKSPDKLALTAKQLEGLRCGYQVCPYIIGEMAYITVATAIGPNT